MTTTFPPIDRLVELQFRVSPSLVPALRSKYKSIASELTPEKLGSGEAPTLETAGSPTRNMELLKERALFAIDVLNGIIPDAKEALIRCISRLAVERKLRLCGQLISLIGSSSVVGALSFNQDNLALITGIITLVATGVITVADYFGFASGGNKLDVQTIYERLNDTMLQSTILIGELKLSVKAGDDPEVISQKIADANELARSINKDISMFRI